MNPHTRTGRIPFLPILASLMILVPVLIVAGCTGNAPADGGNGTPSLDATRWVLTGYLSGGSLVAPAEGTSITLEFGKGGSITGTAGCNHYFADYKVKGTTITVGQAGSTEMYCTGPGVMEQEAAFLQLLPRAARVTSGSDILTFSDSAGTTILTFTRLVPPAPEPLQGTNWTLDSVYSRDAVSSVVSGTTITLSFGNDFIAGGSAGCNEYWGLYRMNGSSLGIDSITMTKKNCPGHGVMLQETTYLTLLQKTAGFTITGNRLSLTGADGATLLSFTKGA